ncbi:ferrous iron transport protein B [Heyndrickxia sporothermodurans]|uniref:Ferrous iron transport protein B n=1 Tax=Heyndrickxia sporothermodurans TaxID=46224 RepID=A0AB37HJ29_9BACI|nr:ferrous iron transport protein B [Heyndrickxia sporothermodurans]MBL5766224.1 ferrous iron transport protein B [Heyndrickxia sporothermodurans]MBL5769664.1 ferrous iron transport protein B [Heyndrickxia sporothermodurans]MBL5773560.1 ferrous iron transport protein B [Heyndrickxia sporothermodurans]MBL5776833.1 ferrous iron transport protein B [Heyndrickxia sporothermodurans]MBL5780422.1 ferrous iron transport protein B [Heyndrickxia sporothermodurans]
MMQTALVGNPNTGKTSLFNYLTGSYEYVGNWSGVTVEKKVGKLKDVHGELIDLPGVYSLYPLSKDESVVTRFFLNESFTNIINIVDASQLERNLQLTIQILEFGKPVVIGLNMVDVAKRRGLEIDGQLLAKKLGTPVVPITARNGKGCNDLAVQLNALDNTSSKIPYVYYGKIVENGIMKIIQILEDEKIDLPKRWLALQLLEGNPDVTSLIKNDQISQVIEEVEQKLKTTTSSTTITRLIFDSRKQWIDQVIKESSRETEQSKNNWTEKIDKIVTHRWLGIPIFLAFMFLMFKITFDWLGTPLSDGLDAFFTGPLTDWIQSGLQAVHASSFIQALVLQGIIAGVGGVLVFVPQIFILFLFISFLEDSGYMARAALVMDRMMERAGLNGKAFIPMIIGFGCNVPGVMAARTIEQPKERLLTILLTPLMSCSARLSIYALFVGAFFEKYQAIVVFSLYLLGVVVALLLAKLFSKTLMKNESSVFVIELPPYRVPQILTLWRSTWDKGKGFVRKAGTFIFGGSVVIWLLSYMGPGGIGVDMDNSFLAMIGKAIAPLIAPLGFGVWQAGAALIPGFLAKEVVVSSMNIIYHTPNTASLQGLLTDSFTPLSAYSFLVFVLLYIPCVATVAAIRNEAGSWKWTLFGIGYSLVIAYALSFVIYQGGRLIFGL